MDTLNFADHSSLEETNAVERYLMGKLSATEAERFEEHYLDCDECLEKLELSKQLYQGLREIAAEEVPKVLIQTAVAQTTLLAWLFKRGRAFQGAVALGILCMVILPWAFLMPEMSRLRGQQERLSGKLAAALAPQSQTPAYRLSPERSGPGEEPSTRVTLGATPEWVVLSLQLPPNQSAVSYRVRLLEAGGTTLWQGGPFKSETFGQVTLRVHSSWLEAATYHLELVASNMGGDDPPSARFSFLVRRGGI
jgi:hypothetical protein